MKNRNYPFKKKSINNRLTAWVLIILVPLLTVLLVSNFYAIKVVRNQVAESNKGTLELYINKIDQSFKDIERYLANTASNMEGNFPIKPNEDDTAKFKRQYNLYQELIKAKNVYPTADAFFAYVPSNGQYIESTKDDFKLDDRMAVRAFLQTVAVSKDETFLKEARSWYAQKINNKYYFLRTFKVGQYFMGTYIEVERLMQPVSQSEFGLNKLIYFTTEQGNILSNSTAIVDQGIQIKNETNYYLTGKDRQFLAIEMKSIYKKFGMIVLVKENNILEGLDNLQTFIVILSILSISIVPISLLQLEKAVRKPLKRIVKAMSKVKNGDLDTKMEALPDYSEYVLVSEIFDSMLTQIKQLKIDVYEEQILKQKSELQYLELQINPHFFLNSLNIIYSMAEVESYDLIKDMSLSLVKHFRYILKSKGRLVTLEEELAYTENYLYIQEMRYANSFGYEIEMEPKLQSALVPPIIIQTFVENTIKYAMNAVEHVFLKVHIFEDELLPDQFLQIVIYDTGNGFDEDVLRQLNLKTKISDARGEHFGIYNITHRLGLLYKEQADIRFSNRDPQGAQIQMRLPLLHKSLENNEE